MSRLARTFARLEDRAEGALVGYLMGGDPDIARCKDYFAALLDGGVDILEVGIPFSDPIADGPTIQRASTRALAAKATPARVLDVVDDLRARGVETPILLMTYANILFARGWDRFAQDAKVAGADGFIVPDLPADESDALVEPCRRLGLDVVQLAAPSTPKARLAPIVERSSGFLYLVARYGVTGAHSRVDASLGALVRRVKPLCAAKRLPLAVGFGLSEPSDVRAVLDAGADAAVVGSAFVQRVERGEDPKALRDAARTLKAVTRARKAQVSS